MFSWGDASLLITLCLKLRRAKTDSKTRRHPSGHPSRKHVRNDFCSFQKPLGNVCFFTGSMDRLKGSLVADETGGTPAVAGRQSFLFLTPPRHASCPRNGSVKEEAASFFFYSLASSRCEALKGPIVSWPRRIACPTALRHNYAAVRFPFFFFCGA